MTPYIKFRFVTLLAAFLSVVAAVVGIVTYVAPGVEMRTHPMVSLSLLLLAFVALALCVTAIWGWHRRRARFYETIRTSMAPSKPEAGEAGIDEDELTAGASPQLKERIRQVRREVQEFRKHRDERTHGKGAGAAKGGEGAPMLVDDDAMRDQTREACKRLRHYLGLSLRDMAREAVMDEASAVHHYHSLYVAYRYASEWADELCLAAAGASPKWGAVVSEFRRIVSDLPLVLQPLERPLVYGLEVSLLVATGQLYKLVDAVGEVQRDVTKASRSKD